MSITCDENEYLIKAEGLEPRGAIFIRPRGTLTEKDAQAALDAQYGKYAFRAWAHGSALWIINQRAAS